MVKKEKKIVSLYLVGVFRVPTYVCCISLLCTVKKSPFLSLKTAIGSHLSLLIRLNKPTHPFLIWVFQTVSHPGWDILQIWSHKCQMEGKNQKPWPAGCTLANTSQDVVVCLYCKGTLLARVHLIVLQDPQVFFLQNCFLASQCPPCIVAQGYSSPHEGRCIFLHWSSWGSICLACLDPDFWPIDHSPHTWYCPQTCWEYILSHQPYCNKDVK